MSKILFITLGCLMLNTSEAASFDCSKAASTIEKLICSNDELSQLDVTLNKTYQQALNQSMDKHQIANKQKLWLKNVRNTCRDAKCIKDTYIKRIDELNQADSQTARPPEDTPANGKSVLNETFFHFECSPKTGRMSIENGLTTDLLPGIAHAGQISDTNLAALEKQGYYSVQRSDFTDGCTIGRDTYAFFIMYHDQQERGACAAAEFWQLWFTNPKGDQFVYTLDGDMCIPDQPLLKNLRVEPTQHGYSVTVCASDYGATSPTCRTVPAVHKQ